MASIKILGIDPAMDSTGWMLVNFDSSKALRETDADPKWITAKDSSGRHTYQHCIRVDGGTFKSDQSKSSFYRVQRQAEDIHQIVYDHKPDVIAIESQLDKGDNKNPTGLSLSYLILFPYFHPERQRFRLLKPIDPHTYGPSPIPVPEAVVLIRPERLQSIAHYERKTKGTEVVRRYKHLCPEDKHRISQHEVDGFFLSYHASRFLAVTHYCCWDMEILTEKETHCFVGGPKCMHTQQEESWWLNEPANRE